MALPLVELTPERIQKLSAQLDKDLVKVNNSTADTQTKADINNLITNLQNGLKRLLAEAAGSPMNIPLWATQIKPAFQQLKPLLAKALNLTPTTDQGACFYLVGGMKKCIQTTQTQCDELGPGTDFEPGQPCPPD